MKLRSWLVAGAVALLAAFGIAHADVNYTAGSGTVIFTFTCFSTKVCPAHTVVNSAGTEILTAAAPGQVTGANGTFPATQSGTWNVTNVSGTVSLPTGASTAAKQPALGTAGSASTDVLTIQGIASMTKLLVTPDANSAVNVGQINGVTPLMGNGVTGTGSQRVTIASDNTAFSVNAVQSGTWTVQPGNTANTTPWLMQGNVSNASSGVATGSISVPTIAYMYNKNGGGPWDAFQPNVNGQATMANSAPVVVASNQSNLPVINGGSRYQAVAASQTATVLQSSTGATGDYLSHCVIYPASTSPGVVTVFDNTNTAANSAILFAGGASSLSNLAPISVPVGALSRNGAWEVTTGANVSVVCYGKFS